ncbi:transcriptional regulator [Saccharicrinis carchari]|uniref:Transcriptional regulator n=1 Tax=Saccharicrinis carchari TaxID=1168039 RepID=A0A521BZW1_SACCC|nr:response regulator transcription factor [Saccharicrinis carchari]SMO52756.1 transcriptional regulator [Saccharicrinis carchari]
MIRILVAEPSYLIRKGIVTILSELKAVTVIDEANNPEELQQSLQQVLPHILMVNTSISSLPQADKVIKKYVPDMEVIYVFNTPLPHRNDEQSLSVFDSKSLLLSKLRRQVENIEKSVVHHDNSGDLTEREKDVLQKVALGKTNKEVANELFISTHTVISHRKNITRKLGIKTVSGLTVYAILNNLIKLEDIS